MYSQGEVRYSGSTDKKAWTIQAQVASGVRFTQFVEKGWPIRWALDFEVAGTADQVETFKRILGR